MAATPAERELWLKAIEDELRSLEEKLTWREAGIRPKRRGCVSKGPNGESILPTHVILKIKRDEQGLPIRFKARIVAGGRMQIHRKDFDAVYAPVVDFTNVLPVLAVALQLGWSTRHIDFKTAFLNYDIDRETYVSNPVNIPQHMQNEKY